jgi:hypothetical protein
MRVDYKRSHFSGMEMKEADDRYPDRKRFGNRQAKDEGNVFYRLKLLFFCRY